MREPTGVSTSVATHVSWRMHLGVLTCGVAAFLNGYCTQPLLPTLGRYFGAGKVQLGMTISAVTIGLALSAPVFGVFAENSSRKRVIAGTLIALTVITALAGLAPNLPALIMLRFLQGIILPGVITSAVAYVNEEFSGPAVASLMRTYVSGTVLGGFIGRFDAGFVAHQSNWRVSFFSLAGLTVLAAIAIQTLLPASQCIRARSTQTGALGRQLQTLRRHTLNPRLVPLSITGFSILFCLVATFTYITYYLAAPPFSWSSQALGWLFAVYLFGVVATPLSAVVLRHASARATILCSLTLSMAGILLTLVASRPVIVTGLILSSTGTFIAQAASLGYLRKTVEEGVYVSATGFYFCWYYLGGTAGGVLPGYAWRFGGWSATVELICVVLLMAAAVAWVYLGERPLAVEVSPIELEEGFE